MCHVTTKVAKEAIWHATNGHPGLVMLCLDSVREYLVPKLQTQGRESGATDDSQAIVRHLLSYEFYQALSHTRALPTALKEEVCLQRELLHFIVVVVVVLIVQQH
jgi:hypothetical protein